MRFLQSISIVGFSFSVSFSTRKAINFNILIAKTPSKDTFGITSRCRDGRHVLFFDFDGLTKDEVLDELTFLQIYYNLGNFYVFQLDMDNSFHAICLDKLSLTNAVEIISNSSADKGFKKAPYIFKRKRWVLRVDKKGKRKKPIYISTLKSIFQNNQKSQSHKVFLELHYNLKLGKLKYLDGLNDSIEIINYNTASKV